MTLDTEYETLRAEVLQLFGEQNNLAFATAVSSAAIVFGLLQTEATAGVGVAVWLLILIGIGWKLISNYNRLHRIVTYLKVIHELKGQPADHPGIGEPAWHGWQRRIADQLQTWNWGSGARMDARFLRILGTAGIAILVIDTSSNWPHDYAHWVSSAIALGLCFVLWWQTDELLHLDRARNRFETALWNDIDLLNLVQDTKEVRTLQGAKGEEQD